MADNAPAFKRYTEIPYYSWTEFDSVQSVKAAIKQLEMGQFNLASMLCDSMTRDDRISGCMMMRAEALTHLPVTFNAAQGDRAEAVALEVEEHWNTFIPDDQLKLLQKWALFTGLGVGENVWAYDEKLGRVMPRLKAWHPRWVYWRWDTRTFWLVTQEGPIPLDFNTGQWVLHAPLGLHLAFMQGLVRSLYVPWLLRQWALRDEGRYSEAYGGIIKKARVPAGASDDDSKRFLSEVAASGSETTVKVIQDAEGKGYDLELLEATGAGFDGMNTLVSQQDANIAIRILGQNLTTEVKAGSFAAAGVHQFIRQDLLDADGKSLSGALHQQQLEWYALFNHGDRALAPKPPLKGEVSSYWVTAPPEDKKAAGDAQLSLGNGVKALVLAGVPVDGIRFAEKYGIPLRDEVPEEKKRRLVPVDATLIALGVPTVNEARDAIGLTAAKGGDEIPEVNPKPEPRPPGGGPPAK